MDWIADLFTSFATSLARIISPTSFPQEDEDDNDEAALTASMHVQRDAAIYN